MNEWDNLAAAGNDAPLKEAKATESTTKPKHLNAMPVTYFDAHKALKSDGKTSLDFSQYIYEAVREKLEREGAL